jgi:hypothetical protein
MQTETKPNKIFVNWHASRNRSQNNIVYLLSHSQSTGYASHFITNNQLLLQSAGKSIAYAS